MENAPNRVKEFIIGLPKALLEFIEITPDAIYLADKYITENVVGKTSRDDCIHIALATINSRCFNQLEFQTYCELQKDLQKDSWLQCCEFKIWLSDD